MNNNVTYVYVAGMDWENLRCKLVTVSITLTNILKLVQDTNQK